MSSSTRYPPLLHAVVYSLLRHLLSPSPSPSSLVSESYLSASNALQRRRIHPGIDKGFGPVAFLVFDAGALGHEAGGLSSPLDSPALTCLTCLHQSCLPPLTSPAPIGLTYLHPEKDGSALILGSSIGSRHGVFLLFLSYISLLFFLLLYQLRIHSLLLLFFIILLSQQVISPAL
ncbi:hypothetical protein K440DRAFT_316508 [Wilcoxina mikolae CBS 423.85]|nr:hypothetical protein K440DRAFT_316508 [Wilcoxina mikolae CBS 423.85]